MPTRSLLLYFIPFQRDFLLGLFDRDDREDGDVLAVKIINQRYRRIGNVYAQAAFADVHDLLDLLGHVKICIDDAVHLFIVTVDYGDFLIHNSTSIEIDKSKLFKN